MIENVGALDSRRFYSLTYWHNGKTLKATVGEPDPLEGNLVIAIFRTARSSGPYLICTPDRGVNRGDPILAGSGPRARAVEFEMVGNGMTGEPLGSPCRLVRLARCQTAAKG
jgi:hypothetical protein